MYIWAKCTVDGLSQEFPLLRRQPPQERMGRSKEVILLHHQKHFFLVTDFNRLMCQAHNKISRFSSNTTNAKFCHRCMESKDSKEALQKHLRKCRGTGVSPDAPEPRLPSEHSLDSKKPDKCEVKFRNHKNEHFLELMVYSDIETYCTPCESSFGKTTVESENRHIASLGYHTVGTIPIPEEFQNRRFLDLGDGRSPFVEYMRSLCRLALHWEQARHDVQELAMTTEAKAAFAAADCCEHCGKGFKTSKDKCRDHDHFTGKYRAALCKTCNTKAFVPYVVTIGTHNSKNYDNHFYIRGLATLQGSQDGEMGIREFAGFPAGYDKTPLKEWKIDVLPTSSEKFKSVTFGNMRIKFKWIDTCSFLLAPLAKLIEKQSEFYPIKDANGQVVKDVHGNKEYDLSSSFPIVCGFHTYARDWEMELSTNDVTRRLKDLMRKIPFPYRGLTGPEVFDQPPRLARELYFDEFSKKGISDEDYEFVQTLSDKLGLTTFREYHNCYLDTDVLALADVFESFRKTFHEKFGVDPAHYLGIPGAAVDALLKNSLYKGHPVCIENITLECCDGLGPELMKDVNDNVRGGLSCMFTPHAKANNPGCTDYDPEKPITWIVGLDVTSLYPSNMCRALPMGDYRRETCFDDMYEPERLDALHDLLDAYKPTDVRGYMLVVGFEVPEELHDKVDFAPVVSRAVKCEELSERQQLIKMRKAISILEERKAAGPKAKARPKAKAKAQAYSPEDLERMAHQLAKAMHAEGCHKLVPDLAHRVQAVHVEHAQALRKMGARFTSVERVWSFKQGEIFKDFIEARAKERGESKDEAYRQVLKILMNSIFGKMLENKEKYRSLKVHTDPVKFQQAASRFMTTKGGKSPACTNFNIQEDIVHEDGSRTFLGLTKHYQGGDLVLDTPRMIGWAILEYSKMVMNRIHYDHMKPNFAKLQLLMTDTDSFYYLIQSPTDPADTLRELNLRPGGGIFDVSTVERYKDCANKGKLGCMKYETGDSTIEEAVFLCAKMYAIKEADGRVEVKGKGVPSKALKRECKFDNYLAALYQNKRDGVEFFAFRSIDHVIKHCKINRQGLTADNDKVFMLGPHASRPLGHWRNVFPECISIGCAPPSATMDAFGYALQSGPIPGWDLEAMGTQAEAVLEAARRIADERLKEQEKAKNAAEQAELEALRRFYKDDDDEDDESTEDPLSPVAELESLADSGWAVEEWPAAE